MYWSRKNLRPMKLCFSQFEAIETKFIKYQNKFSIFNIQHSNFIVIKLAMKSRRQRTHMRVFSFLHGIPVFPFDIFTDWMIAKSWAGRRVGALHTIVRSPDYWGRHNHPTGIELNTLKWEIFISEFQNHHWVGRTVLRPKFWIAKHSASAEYENGGFSRSL